MFPIDDVRDRIITFSLQSAGTLVGLENINSFRELNQHTRYRLKTNLNELLHDTVELVDNIDNVKSNVVQDMIDSIESDEYKIDTDSQDIHSGIDTTNQASDNEVENIDEEAANEHNVNTLFAAVSTYDNGSSFNGNFDVVISNYGQNTQSTDDSDVHRTSGIELILRTRLHLLSQLCLNDFKLITALVDLYSSAHVYIKNNESKSTEAVAQDEEASSSANIVSSQAGEQLQAVSTIRVEKEDLLVNRLICLENLIINELSSIIPAIISSGKQSQIHIKPEDVFEYILRSGFDGLVVSLIENILQLLLSDIHIPPTSNMIKLVTAFLNDLKSFPIRSAKEKINGDINSELYPDVLIDEYQELSFMIPLLGGFTSEELELEYIPRLVQLFFDKSDKLKASYQRIVLTRPPPMSKTQLVVALHRFFLTLFVL